MGDLAVVLERVRGGGSVVEHLPAMHAFIRQQGDVAVLKECKAQASAIVEYLANQTSVKDYNAAVTVKLDVEHRLGQVLAETVRRGGDRKSKCRAGTLIPNNLAETPYKRRKLSARTQQLAAIPWEVIETRVAAATAADVKVTSTTRLIKELCQQKQREANEQLVRQATPLAEAPGVFSTLAVDPPWDWGDEGDQSQLGRGRHEYTPMPFDDLLRLPVGEKAAANAHLYLWITNRSLPKGFRLLDAWGFRYVTALTWCKPSIGMGNYFRGSTEQVLFGVRGSLPLLRKDVGTWFAAGRQGPHSTKPEEFYRLVESCSPGPWLELFARRRRNGWTSWGAET